MAPEESFGILLRRYRKRTLDPSKQGPLSMERLAELVDVGPTTVSLWENDKRRIRAEDRRLLLLLISVLYKHSGIKNLREANALLKAGGYRPLDDAEREQALPGLPSEQEGVQEEHELGQDDESFRPQPGRPFILLNLRAILFRPERQEDESALASAVLYWLGRPAEYLTAEGVLRLVGLLFLWLAAALAWQLFLSWPYPDDAVARRACIVWGCAAALVPMLLGLIIRCDRQAHLEQVTHDRRGILARRVTGALGGYQIGAAAVFVLALLLFYLALWPLPRWLIVLLAGLPLLLAYAAGRRMPYNYFMAFRTGPVDASALRLDEGDLAVFLAFVAFGPLLAAFFYVYRNWLLQPVVGAALLGVGVGLATVLQLVVRRRDPQMTAPPAEAVVLLVGIPLGLWMAVQPGVEPLLGLGLTAGLIMAALLLRRGAPIRLAPLLGFVAGLALLAGLAQIDVWLGRLGLILLLMACWRWRSTLFWPWLPFWMIWLLLMMSLILLRWAALSPWLVRGGFAATVLALLIWEVRKPKPAQGAP